MKHESSYPVIVRISAKWNGITQTPIPKIRDFFNGMDEAEAQFLVRLLSKNPSSDGENGDRDQSSESEPLEEYTEGTLLIRPDETYLTYTESVSGGMEDTTTQIFFSAERPGLVTLSRTGSVRMSMTFEKGSHYLCSYSTREGTFEVRIGTLDVRNDLLNSGNIYLDYLMDSQGVRLSRCRMTIRVELAPQEPGTEK